MMFNFVDEDPEQRESNGVIHAEAHAAGGIDSKQSCRLPPKGGAHRSAYVPHVHRL